MSAFYIDGVLQVTDEDLSAVACHHAVTSSEWLGPRIQGVVEELRQRRADAATQRLVVERLQDLVEQARPAVRLALEVDAWARHQRSLEDYARCGERSPRRLPRGQGGTVTDAELDEMERGMRAFQLDDDRAREEWDPAQCALDLIAEVRRLRAEVQRLTVCDCGRKRSEGQCCICDNDE